MKWEKDSERVWSLDFDLGGLFENKRTGTYGYLEYGYGESPTDEGMSVEIYIDDDHAGGRAAAVERTIEMFRSLATRLESFQKGGK